MQFEDILNLGFIKPKNPINRFWFELYIFKSKTVEYTINK